MTVNEKRHALAEKIISREGKNTYTQDSKRDQVATGFGDCSSTVRWVYKEVLGIDIGTNTNAQIQSTKLETVPVAIKNGIPDITQLKEGDLFYFRGDDETRYKGVGHVEEYIGNGQLMGHGSGIGPRRHGMEAYCKSRFESMSDSASLRNKGLICVRRAPVTDDVSVKPAAPAKPASSNIKVTPKTNPIKPVIDTAMLKGYVGNSIIDALNSKGKSTMLTYRRTLAEAVGIMNYRGTAEQNLLLIKALGGKLK